MPDQVSITTLEYHLISKINICIIVRYIIELNESERNNLTVLHFLFKLQVSIFQVEMVLKTERKVDCITEQ